jgi:hypothetical protein
MQRKKISGSHEAVMRGQVMSCKKFCEVIATTTLPLFDTVTYPIKMHVNCFGASLVNGVVGDASGTKNVCL